MKVLSQNEEKVARIRAKGKCEWVSLGLRGKVVCGTEGIHLRCLRIRMNEFNAGIKYLCSKHYDEAVISMQPNPSKKPTPIDENQILLF